MNALDSFVSDPRIRVRRDDKPSARPRCVVYWMQRSQRGRENPALNVAIDAANALGLPLAVHFGLHPRYPRANARHYAFLLDGIPEAARHVEARGAAFVFRPYPHHSLLRFCEEVAPALVVGDENPLREPESWRDGAARNLRVPFWTVDSDVIVPSCHFDREEYAARTLRPKIRKLLRRYLKPLGRPRCKAAFARSDRPRSAPFDARDLLTTLPLDRSAAPLRRVRGGRAAGLRTLRRFTTSALPRYHEDRNRPDLPGTSRLSAYLHFGQLGPHEVALAVRRARAPREARRAFLEELIVRRELAVNFVARNPRYDRVECGEPWALRTLTRHARDPRERIYSEKALEAGATSDRLWNAAQLEMVATGRMHGYLRMYWAKRLLDWTPTPADAYRVAVELNDRHELDGRDPNGYAGIAWAICGKHDRPWPPERPVLGFIRPMTASGAARKFDVDEYVASVGRAAAREGART
ncbi:MAG TPA: deoxyribodipyrimidine photo-lyase [Candidatus Eisenbacteria bacterium]|nr:deoxyribodipyrimidine photo-lyase [Candidatus Eisenbacteria bacterium]